MNEDLKRCSKCKTEKLVIKFHKDNKQKDGLYYQCKAFRKQNYNENLVKFEKYFLDNRDRIKDYYLQNRAEINIYKKNRRKTDLNFKLACNLRSRTSKS